MHDWRSLAHVRWGCKYHVVIIPKYRRKVHFWVTGYCVSTVGLDEDRIRKYIREQDSLASRQGDMDLKQHANGPQGAFST